MGTSTDYGGAPNWGPTKSQITQAAGGGLLTKAKAGSLLRSLTSEMNSGTRLGFGRPLSKGGGRGGAGVQRTGGRSIRTAARGLGSFLADVAKSGFREALAARGLTDLDGKSYDQIALDIADALSGPTSLIDDTIVREAVLDLISEWSGEIESFDEMESAAVESATHIEAALRQFLGHYIYRVYKVVGYAGMLEKHGFEKAESMSSQIRDVIDAKLSDVSFDRSLTDVDWTGQQGAQIVDSIVDHTIEIFGGENE